MYHKRRYKPLHPEKYEGNPHNIVLRSSWETKFALWCDNNPAVKRWSSEEVIIPYLCPTDGRAHRYYVDFKITVEDKNGEHKTYLVEVKPEKQTRPPQSKRKTKRYLAEVMTYGKNQAKWEAARRYCAQRGYEFMIITEKHLGLAK